MSVRGQLSKTISPRDVLFIEQHPEGYFDLAEASMRTVRLALDLADVTPQRILDFPCGHGRILRWLAAEFDAEIVACDLDPDAVDFCAQEFAATPLYSHVEPESVLLQGKFDFIICSSLFTHVDAPMWQRFLRVFVEHLDGVLIFTTGGRSFGRHVQERDLGADGVARLNVGYEQGGFGYADYRTMSGYGLARAKPSWVLSLLEELPLQVIHMAEGGWDDGWQDVYALRPTS